METFQTLGPRRILRRVSKRTMQAAFPLRFEERIYPKCELELSGETTLATLILSQMFIHPRLRSSPFLPSAHACDVPPTRILRALRMFRHACYVRRNAS